MIELNSIPRNFLKFSSGAISLEEKFANKLWFLQSTYQCLSKSVSSNLVIIFWEKY